MNKESIKKLPCNSPLNKKPFGGLSTDVLKILAVIFDDKDEITIPRYHLIFLQGNLQCSCKHSSL